MSIPRPKPAQAGAVAIEFSLALLLLLMIAFAVLELARVMYLYNTLQVVTMRAATLAANANFMDSDAMTVVRQQALLRDAPGTLILGEPVTDASIRIDYLALTNSGAITMSVMPAASLPACPINNRTTCLKDPYSSSCIRLVRAQICDPAVTATCSNVQYQSLFSMIRLPLSLPKAPTIVRAETLGAKVGDIPCL